MQENVDLAVRVMETVLFVPDALHRVAGHGLQDFRRDRRRTTDFTGQDDAVGGGERLARDAGLRLRREKGVDDGIRDAIANLVRVPFGRITSYNVCYTKLLRQRRSRRRA